ncbi:MAG TPA: hypothetical protein VF453_21805 [Burkholderiaceae bacterium]
MSLAGSTLLVMASRILVMFAGLIVSAVAAHSLSSVEQGYFFTFMSLAAAQTLFELGITNLILHHLSHARAGILCARTAEGKRTAIALAMSTRDYSTRYFRRAAGLFIVFVGTGGAAFFGLSRSASGAHWQSPWMLMLAGTALSLFNLSFYSYLEAFGRLSVSYRVRMASTVILVVAFSVAAALGGGLLSYPLALLVANGCAFAVLRRSCMEVDHEHGLTGAFDRQSIGIGREQRKMAASAVAGYVTANSLTPYAFHFFGPEIAGRFGLTMSIFTAIAAVAMARTTAEAPTYGPLIAAGEWATLMARFRQTLFFSAGLALLLGILAIAGRRVGLEFAPRYANRVLDTTGFVIVGLLIVANVTLSVTSTVLRAFKIERLMWPSLTAALVVLAAQLALRLDPAHCLALLAAFNGFVFFPYARHLLTTQIALSHG